MIPPNLTNVVVAAAEVQQGAYAFKSFPAFMADETLVVIDHKDPNTCHCVKSEQDSEGHFSLFHAWVGRYICAWHKTIKRLELIRLYIEESLAPFEELPIGKHLLSSGRRELFERRVSYDHLWGEPLIEMNPDHVQSQVQSQISTVISPVALKPEHYIPVAWIPHPKIFPNYSLGMMEVSPTNGPKVRVQ
jgi:hypothetical protein